uniref:Uncharacterized protein n=1 Tax=Anguilla anguilla TaxID=7936 RepID=A0A0E9SS47_ANGAN
MCFWTINFYNKYLKLLALCQRYLSVQTLHPQTLAPSLWLFKTLL